MLTLLSLFHACTTAPVTPAPQTAPLPAMTPEEAAAAVPTETYELELVAPPMVPPPIHRDHAAKVVIHLPVVEKVGEIADGVQTTVWTFGGDVPGRFLRVRQGDTVELHLQNDPGNKMPHSIDLHAVTGPGGGAVATPTAPGHETVLTFKALTPGLYVYHCATAPVPMHIANGMYGLILVEPPAGLPAVDDELYVMQGDWYTTGDTGEQGLQAFDPAKARDERPTYVLFNGRKGGLSGPNALKVAEGDRVRLYFGNGGPNLTSSAHVIGEVFDRLWPEAGAVPELDVQTTSVPPGGATMAELTFEVPGDFLLVDHALSRAFDKGAIAMFSVKGDARPDVFAGRQPDLPYAGTGAPAPAAAAVNAVEAARSAGTLTREQQLAAGKTTFEQTCAGCHQQSGEGVAGAFPPLAGSDFLFADRARALGIPVHGLSGKITVLGKEYDGVMPPFGSLSDEELADVLTYVRSSWGNAGDTVTPAEIAAARGQQGS